VDRDAIAQATEELPEKGAQSALRSSTVDSAVFASAYDADGVDRSLIRWMLSLTPSERLRHVQGTIDLVHKAKRVPNGDRKSRGHKLLQTTAGPLDALATIETNTTFEDLLPDSDWLEVDGARFRVLSLARLIVVKEQLMRPKDQAMLVLLRATLDESRKPRP
jgi:predicted nucleotidyltransferase